MSTAHGSVESPSLSGRPTLLAALCLCLLMANPLAWAVVGGAGDDPPASASPWSGVGQVEVVNDQKTGSFTGALIGPRLVLTAAHVVGGRKASQIRFRLHLGEGQTILAASAVHVHPGFHGTRAGPDGFWHKDLALIELSEAPPPGVAVYPLARRSNQLKSQVVFIGFGGGGDGLHGVTKPGGVRRVGYNRIDALLGEAQADGRQSAPDLMLFDFDGPDPASNRFKPDAPFNASLGPDLEAIFAGGDSGAPLFVFEDGRMRLVGVAAFVAGPGTEKDRFGAIGGATLVPAFVPWIQQVVPRPSD